MSLRGLNQYPILPQEFAYEVRREQVPLPLVAAQTSLPTQDTPTIAYVILGIIGVVALIALVAIMKPRR